MLIPEAPDIFFARPGRAHSLPQGSQGQPDLLIDRRNNEDVVWNGPGKEVRARLN
jgi:hypothetical protein